MWPPEVTDDGRMAAGGFENSGNSRSSTSACEPSVTSELGVRCRPGAAHGGGYCTYNTSRLLLGALQERLCRRSAGEEAEMQEPGSLFSLDIFWASTAGSVRGSKNQKVREIILSSWSRQFRNSYRQVKGQLLYSVK